MATKKKVAKKSTARKATKKKAAKKPVERKATAKKKAGKKAAGKKAAKKAGSRKNKLGVKNSLVNNINARKAKGKSRPVSKTTIAKDAYENMQQNWGKE